MPASIRNILAVFIGLVVGFTVNMVVIEFNTSMLFPPPESVDLRDPAQFEQYVKTLPALAFVVVMLAHLGQAFVGGWVAARLGASWAMTLAMVVGTITLAGCIIMMIEVPSPTWFAVELPLCLVVAWIAGHLERRRRASGADAVEDARPASA